MSSKQINELVNLKNNEIEKLKLNLSGIEKETKINIENLHKEKNNYILEKQLSEKNLNELQKE
jgi:hypothetical protein